MERRGTEGGRRGEKGGEGGRKDKLWGALGFLNPRIVGYYYPGTSDRSVKGTLETVREDQSQFERVPRGLPHLLAWESNYPWQSIYQIGALSPGKRSFDRQSRLAALPATSKLSLGPGSHFPASISQ